MSNTFGSILRIITFGESHGVSIGGVIDGFPAGFKINISDVQKKLNFRRPGFSNISTERKEDDNVEFSSGLVDGVTTGAPIAFLLRFLVEILWKMLHHTEVSQIAVRSRVERLEK